jgi:ATP-dependent RNA helicase DDX42
MLTIYRAGVKEQVKEDEKTIGKTSLFPEIVSGIDSTDYDSYLVNDESENGNIYLSDDDVEYDQDGLVVGKKRSLGDSKIRVEPLTKVDHSLITYKPFKKQFYKEHNELKSISMDDISTLREELEIHIISSENVPCPIKSFKHSGFDILLLNEIVKVGYDKPTPIQSQALPVILSGRDIIGLAKTGSGKTLAFLWPMILHILDQPQMKSGDGPIGLVLAPTRELASQILLEAKKFAKIYNIRVVGIIGGTGKWELTKQLKESPEIIIATPGRFIDLCGKKATNLSRCTMVVLDEADRMFEMGFEYQMRSIVNNIRPDRQTLLFSATMKKKVEGFAREMLTNPVRIVVGTIGMANPDIKQLVEMVNNDNDKWCWLSSRADEFVAEGKVLIFVLSKKGVEELALSLQNYFKSRQLDIGVECLHGDKLQSERTSVMKKFSKSNSNTTILVATDVAARGLDVKDIRTVINYDVAKNIETYVHRIGRTGRMGVDGIVPGTSYTLVTPQGIS